MQEVDTYTEGNPSEARFITNGTPRTSADPAPRKMPELDLETAYKTMRFYQEKPQYLANPFTSKVANAHFSQAAKIVGMNIQIEKLNNSTHMADAQIQQDRGDIKSFITLSPFLTPEELGSITDDDGRFALTKDSRMSLRRLQGVYADKINPSKVNDPGEVVSEEVNMPDGSTIQIVRNTTGKGYTVVPRKADTDAAIKDKESTRKISQLESDARDFEKKYVSANAEYVEKMVGKKMEGDAEKALKAKADYLRAQQNKKLQEAETLRAPISAPTNAPAASAPEKVRVKGPNGQTGQMPKGSALPKGWTLE